MKIYIDKKETYKKEIIKIIEKINDEITLKALYNHVIEFYRRYEEHRAAK